MRIEIRPALPAAHRERRQGILDHLLEGKKLEHAEVYRLVETKPAFIRAERAVHLDAKAAVDLDLTLVVLPRHAKHDHALGLDDALEDLGLCEVRASLKDKVEAFEDFFDRLVEFRLCRIFRPDAGKDVADVRR